VADSNIADQKQLVENVITLKNIFLKIRAGEFVCIIGDVGSGKSSLLSALIGDLLYVSQDQIDKYGGMRKALNTVSDQNKFQEEMIDHINNDVFEAPITINGEIAFVQQVPWIQNKTIRDNILYGLPLDKAKYVDTIQICELERDLEILPAGDLTEIGEKGINLSGGQKARISLARAVYSNKDIFLMDDPISALDANVRKKIFQNVILGHLRDKTRVLVTHAIDFIHLADKIVIMEKGRISAQGTLENLFDNPQLRKLMEINELNKESTLKESSNLD
jgi:ABC-type bacteriocin/lantibiotic exporter with double-glycine peptidase domain